MKKPVLLISVIFLLLSWTGQITSAQEQPAPKKDTVNIDTDAKPTFYYAVEDEKSEGKSVGSGTKIAIIGGVVVVLGIAGFFLLRKKK